ncbi:GntR family transcriptional regulator [Saccharopolyspora phatthalungensis]|uniref:DNA-binding GntR family transcriptional regulator n=1 Tax=Saccharopolyspora phatthalungensis TaxID=664693 RepID=A0A840QE69_9PSEU|nr:GntR family transcriptional regulator [Saccharopolyspora phatthalungensis]MBB5158307.1 DNA-binding GntR family transcriptional regulator [Saccharopolyspora phatthalungensis]
MGENPAAMATRFTIPISLRKQDWAYQQLRQWILAGTLEPGEQLSQERLATELGISRVPLRHALSRLASEGLVVDRPHQRWTVAEVSLNDAADVYHGRAALEAMLAEAAARTVAEVSGDVSALEEIEALLAEQRQAAAAGDRARVSVLDRRFHGAIYALAGMPASTVALEQLRTKSDRYVALYLADVDRVQNSLAEHTAMMAALRSGDAATFADLTRAHVLGGLEVLAHLLSGPAHSDRSRDQQ